ncbi:unnamed protein product [Parajaminaea phylloscopi]
MAASVEEFIELLASEQYVDIPRLRHLARHGVHPAVRGEVWMYLLGVLSSDKSQEMTSVRQLYNKYDALLSHSVIHPDVQAAIAAEANRVWRTRVPLPETAASKHKSDLASTSKNVLPHSDPQSRKRAHIPVAKPMDLELALGACINAPSSKSAQLSRDSSNPRPGSWDDVFEHADQRADDDERSQVSDESLGGASGSDLTGSPQNDCIYEPLREAFVKRVCNIVGVWIVERAERQMEAGRADNSADAAKVAHDGTAFRGDQGRERERRHKDSPTSFCGPLASGTKPSPDSHLPAAPGVREREVPSEMSSSRSSSPPLHHLGTFVEEPSPDGLGAVRKSDRTSGAAQSGDVHGERDDDVAVEDEGSDTEAELDADQPQFDPAMGMGVEDLAPTSTFTYSPRLDRSSRLQNPGDEPYRPSHSRSRTSSRRGSQRRGDPLEVSSTPPSRSVSPSAMETRLVTGHRSASEPLRADVDPEEGSDGGVPFGEDANGSPVAGSQSLQSSVSGWKADGPPTPLSARPHGHYSTRVRSGYESPLRRSTMGAQRDQESSMLSALDDTESLLLFSGSPKQSPPASAESANSEDDDDDDDHEGKQGLQSADGIRARVQRRLYHSRLVHLASPFVMVSLNKRVEAGVYFAFTRLMNLLRPPAGPTVAEQLAVFHSLFRRTLPDLKAYFEEEGVDITRIVATWLRGLFAGGGMVLDLRGHERRGGVLRLWDAYFARLNDDDIVGEAVNGEASTLGKVEDGYGPSKQASQEGPQQGNAASRAAHFERSDDVGRSEGVLQGSSAQDHEPHSLHLYVCLAVLLHCKDTLEELDRSECESFLRSLPELDVDKIVSEALNLRLSHKQAAAFSQWKAPSMGASSGTLDKKSKGPKAKTQSKASSGEDVGGADRLNEDAKSRTREPRESTQQEGLDLGPGLGSSQLRVPAFTLAHDLPIGSLPSEGDVDASLEQALVAMQLQLRA